MVDILNASWWNAVRGYGDFGMFILIWLVQLIVYPSFRWTDPGHFKHWHYVYTGLISLFVGPLMLCQTGVYGWSLLTSWQTGIRWDVALNTILLGLNLTTTWVCSVPCHDRLQKIGYDRPTIDRLVSTNWLRTCGWSAMFFVNLSATHSTLP